MTSLNGTIEQPAEPLQRMLDRQAEDELAITRREHRLESDGRRHTQARDEVRERYAITIEPLAHHDDYAKLAAKHLEIGTRMAKLDQEQNDTVTAIARGMASFNKNKIEHQAQSIIDGATEEAFQGFEEMKSRSARLESEVKAHSQALGMLRAQMDSIKADRSIDVTEAVRAAHTRAVTSISEACATLLKALRDEALIREIVTHAGYDNRLPGFQSINDIAELEIRARNYAR
jgi:hypothetical protein